MKSETEERERKMKKTYNIEVDCANCANPVSYTHLDVYKRQGLSDAFVLGGSNLSVDGDDTSGKVVGSLVVQKTKGFYSFFIFCTYC